MHELHIRTERSKATQLLFHSFSTAFSQLFYSFSITFLQLFYSFSTAFLQLFYSFSTAAVATGVNWLPLGPPRRVVWEHDGAVAKEYCLAANARTSHSDRKIESDAAAFLQLFYTFSTAFLQLFYSFSTAFLQLFCSFSAAVRLLPWPILYE